MATKY